MPIRGGGLSQTTADSRYVKKAGDTMLGDLNFPVNGFVMIDSNSVQWRVTVNTNGALVTAQVSSTTMVGPWLSLGLTNIEHS